MRLDLELHGGPLDGRPVVIYAPAWSPPLVLRLPVPLPAAAFAPDALAAVPFLVHTYDRHASTSEDGPFWRYDYRRPE